MTVMQGMMTSKIMQNKIITNQMNTITTEVGIMGVLLFPTSLIQIQIQGLTLTAIDLMIGGMIEIYLKKGLETGSNQTEGQQTSTNDLRVKFSIETTVNKKGAHLHTNKKGKKGIISKEVLQIMTGNTTTEINNLIVVSNAEGQTLETLNLSVMSLLQESKIKLIILSDLTKILVERNLDRNLIVSLWPVRIHKGTKVMAKKTLSLMLYRTNID